MKGDANSKQIKNKELTKKKLIWALGETIKLEGFNSLSGSKVARMAEVDRKLINRYFGGLNKLIDTYVEQTDYWLIFSEQLNELLKSKEFPGSKELVTSVLQNQFSYFFAEKDMQRLILWELTSKTQTMKKTHNARETTGQRLLELTDLHFKDSNINFRAIGALLVGGIYYTILHTINNGGKFTDLDISSEQGQAEIIKAIGQIVDWAYLAAASKQ
jgi:DNA-binding transcriptional regulator YbjK